MLISITGRAQHDAWSARSMPPVEQLREDLWSIPVPIPNSPLRYVNVYVLVSDAGLVVIDAGWDDDDSWTALIDGVASIGAAITDVVGVLITHFHFDHIGLAGRIAAASGCWVALHKADAVLLEEETKRTPSAALTDEHAFLRSLGASAAEAIDVAGTVEEMALFVSVAAPDRWIDDLELFTVGRYSLRAIHTPGHTPGHMAFIDETSRLMFAGDHLLPRITPNVSVNRLWDGDPIGRYLESLDRVAGLDATEVLPAHEWRFVGHHTRAGEIQRHHEHRSLELLEAVARLPRSTPWDLAAELTWSRPWDQYSGRMRVSAVTETAAHLSHLVATGLITRLDGAVAAYVAPDGGDGR